MEQVLAENRAGSNWGTWRFPRTAEEAALWCAFSAGVAVIFSIAAFNILLCGALLAIFLGRVPVRFPRIALPLALFLLGTLIAFAFSPDHGIGMSQIKKMFVYLVLPVLFTTLRNQRRSAAFLLTAAAATTAMAALGCVQYARKVQEAHAAGKGFYEFYVAARITGLQSHWMAFSGQELYGLLIVAAWLMFAPQPRRWGWIAHLALILTGIALILSDTRNVWIAAFCSVVYLLWFWRKKFAMAAPAIAALGILVAPSNIQQRVISIVHPNGYTDSNMHRIVCWRTGCAMIKAHPLLGIGPDMQTVEFYDYVPPDIPWPLPTGFYGHLHSIYIQYAADRGIPTMLMLVWMLVQIIVDASRKLKTLPPGRGLLRFLLHTGIACTIGSMISGIFEYNLNTTVVLALFLAIAACTSIAVEREPNAGQPSPA